MYLLIWLRSAGDRWEQLKPAFVTRHVLIGLRSAGYRRQVRAVKTCFCNSPCNDWTERCRGQVRAVKTCFCNSPGIDWTEKCRAEGRQLAFTRCARHGSDWEPIAYPARRQILTEIVISAAWRLGRGCLTHVALFAQEHNYIYIYYIHLVFKLGPKSHSCSTELATEWGWLRCFNE